MDGSLRISDIVEKTLPASKGKSYLDIARSLFDRLWCYDQVVFDTSQLKARS